jgi:hypothetical protein
MGSTTELNAITLSSRRSGLMTYGVVSGDAEE